MTRPAINRIKHAIILIENMEVISLKKSAAILSANLILISMVGANNPVNCSPKKSVKKINLSTGIKKAKLMNYKNGTYTAKTSPDAEGYCCSAKVTIKNSKIISVNWHIYDKQNRIFDEKYENVFDDNLYKKQCRDDLKGAKTYAPALIKKQNIEKVDAISGATWSNKLFKEAVSLALDKAKA
jgi:major membrane immunogen (membrane-anchored lipoprotein)